MGVLLHIVEFERSKHASLLMEARDSLHMFGALKRSESYCANMLASVDLIFAVCFAIWLIRGW